MSNFTNHIVHTEYDPFMKGNEREKPVVKSVVSVWKAARMVSSIRNVVALNNRLACGISIRHERLS